MPPLLARLRRLLPWSNTRRAWLERLSAVGVAAAVAALILYAGGMDPMLQALAWAVLLLVAAVLFRHDLLKLFGPILWYDLVRSSRRARTYLVRGGYLAALLFVLWVTYLNEWPYAPAGRLLPSQVARFAREFCCAFLITQYVLMVVLTPAFTAGAIAEEKQKKTIQYILATDLRNHEIILGKLASRMTHLGLLLLAGLPVLGALEFLGGVDPHRVLIAFAATAVTMASAAGAGILASVVARPARAALFLAYGWVLGYVVLCWAGWALSSWLAPKYLSGVPVLDQIIAVVEAGNPGGLAQAILADDPDVSALLQSFGAYVLFHGVVVVASTFTASILLRRASLREPLPRRGPTASRHPPVGDRPMLWKEVHADRGPARRRFVILAAGLLIALTLVPVIWNWVYVNAMAPYTSPGLDWRFLRESLNVWVRVVGTLGGCLLLLGVAIHAAYCLRVEKERDTLDSLLTTPLTSEEILHGKWWGAILSVRRLLPWLAGVWVLAVLGGGLHIAAAPLLALSWCVYAAAMASIGLWFSLVSRTALRAVLYTMLAVLGLSAGHWLIWIPCGLLLAGARPDAEAIEHVLLFQGGLTPPAVLGLYLPFGYDVEEPAADLLAKFLTYAMVGNVLWGVFAWVVWQATNQRFKRAGGRADSGAVRERTPPPRRLS